MSAICRNIPYGKFSFENVVDIQKVKQWYEPGYTVNVRGAHFFHPGLGQTCEILRQMFKCNVRANLYLTPSEKSGLIPHYDAHDVIIIQISGKKRWDFYSNNFAKPTERQHFQSSKFDVGILTKSLELSAGDLLYVPRGTSHSAQAIDDSLHVTLGIEEPTIRDVVTNLIACIEEYPEIRDSLEELFESGDFIDLDDISNEVMRRIHLAINIEEIGRSIERVRFRSNHENGDNYVRFERNNK
ncbi:JmjC domain-containing protein [Nitrosomonas ureae]|uniref:Cupin superfamily protein n=1 Tax=Nitrosomonas ureae TaxID=44577 RepID=A0A1H5VD14_9PROT|nr:cupin domain-containing protein [Nitrosomonas ureae]SEF85123.1 Cupin superfamily protein [Nitrosomonas ureae]